MVQEVNYEVQVQQNGRWSIHARYDGHEKETALDEGRQLDKFSSVESVKVIKEVYDTEREIHSEFIVYKSSDMKMSARSKSGIKTKGGSGGDSGTQRSGGSDTWLEGEAEGDGGDYSGGQEGIGGGNVSPLIMASAHFS